MVTEAGALPFYSKWRTLDAHGLNDRVIAKQGLSETYVDEFRPDVIEFHVYSSVYSPDEPWQPDWPEWDRMTKWMFMYAKSRGYREVAVFRRSENAEDYDWYFARPACPDYAKIVTEVSNLRGVIYERRLASPPQ